MRTYGVVLLMPLTVGIADENDPEHPKIASSFSGFHWESGGGSQPYG